MTGALKATAPPGLEAVPDPTEAIEGESCPDG